MRQFNSISGNVLVLCLAMQAVNANAQTAAESHTSDAVTGVQDIIVTAQKRSENVQDVPIAITALSSDALSTRGINSIADVGALSPNTTLKGTAPYAGSSSVLVAFIRGIGQNDFNFNLDPGVGVYLDGVYIARSIGSNSDLLDLERVEVLKGPQGTLFGRNTIGGALNVVTRDPAKEFGYKAELTTGRFNRIDIRGSVDIPLIEDRLYSSISFASKTRDGYQRHIPFPGSTGFVTNDYRDYPTLQSARYGGDRSGNANQQVIRGKLLAYPTENLKVTLSADYMRSDEQAVPFTLLNIVPDRAGTLTGLYNACIGLPLDVLAAAGLGPICGPRGNTDSPAGVLPGLGAVNLDGDPSNDRLPYTNAFVTGDPNTTYAQGPNYSKVRNWGFSGAIEFDLAESATVKSITAYRKLESSFGADIGGAPFNAFSTTFDDEQRQFSQELQLIGRIWSDRWKYVIGAYYFDEQGDHNDDVNYVGGVIQFRSDDRYKTKAYALYTHNNIDITDQFGITLGARYTWEDKKFQSVEREENLLPFKLGVPRLAFPDQSNPPASYASLYPAGVFQQEFENFSYRLGAEYKLTPDIMAYASFANSFKSGSWSTRITIPAAVAPTFGPEKAETYEIGAKTTLFDRALRLNLAAFQTDYRDIQLVVTVGASPTFVNGGTGRIKGFELEARAAPLSGLNLDASVGYLDSRYRSVNPAALGINVSTQWANAPEWTGHFGASYALLLGDKGDLIPRIDYSFVSTTHIDAVNTPELTQEGYSMVDGSLTFESANGRFELQAGVKNIFDRRVLVSGVTYDTIPGEGGRGAFTVGNYNRPREWFLTLRVKS